MSDQNANTFKIRPYARLLSMLGDQLIKNEIVALTELVKNAYDADADNCFIDFVNVSDDYDVNDSSEIIISDDGYGMSKEVLTTHFLNPATPIKKYEQKKSTRGRICQGEKGVGRFSMLKLGKNVTVYSKQAGKQTIHKISFNFEDLDDEYIGKKVIKSAEDDDHKQKQLKDLTERTNYLGTENDNFLFLDELNITYEEATSGELPEDSTIMTCNQGTVIVIKDLKNRWDLNHVKELKDELVKFSPLEVDNEEIVANRDFNIIIRKNSVEDPYYSDMLKTLKQIIEDKALYKISGDYYENKSTIKFTYSEAVSKKKTISIRLKISGEPVNDFEKALLGLSYYKNEILPIFKEDNSRTECGSFGFEFYIFDFAATAADDYGLTKEEKEKVRAHRIFLYRDGVRVQPYGAPDDDWLQIDRKRATSRANEMFSNDQIIGQIKISKEGNPNLKDKTSREGIIEDGQAFAQLTAVVRVFLSLIRTCLYQQYAAIRKKRKEHEKELHNAENLESYNKLAELLKDDKQGQKYLKDIKKTFTAQQIAFNQRMEVVESLAGVGLSVEASSHDIMLTLSRLRDITKELSQDIELANKGQQRSPQILERATRIEELLSIVEMKMKNLQSLFVSSKQRVKNTQVEPLIKKIEKIYSKSYSENSISVKYKHIGKSHVTAILIDAVIYQVFINLFDNALYWLKTVEGERKVTITFNGLSQEVIFSDSGYGVINDDIPFIFDAFYSGKGEEGRGLGLYIAKRLLNRYQYDIELITNPKEKIEKGANFRVSFGSKEE